MKQALRFAVPYWRRLSLVLGLSLVSTLLSLGQPYLSKILVDKALLGHDITTLWQIVLAFAVLSLVSFGLNVTSGLRYTRVSAEILFDMRLALYRHLQRLSPRFYARTRLGEIVSRINNDIGEIQRIAAEAALAWVGNVLYLIGTIAVLIWLDPVLFALSVAMLPFSLLALVRYRKQLEAKVADLRRISAEIGSFLIESLQGMRLVAASNAQEREVASFRQKNDSFIRALMSMQLLTYFAGGLPNLILTAGTTMAFLYGGYQVIHSRITMGTLVAFLAYQMRLLPPIQSLMGLYASLATARVSLNRVQQLLDVPAEVTEIANPVRLPKSHGTVEFDSVSFGFDRDAKLLDRVSFTLNAGETIAIVGPSGGGKSTVADLLLRFFDPDSGVVRLDGQDLRTLRLHDVRSHIVLVEQEPFLFHTSIAENLRYVCPAASDEELTAAAHAAGIHTFIDSLPSGYATVVGERGMALSAGERQRIAIARAFLANPSVLILDEPTAALDPGNERHVIDSYSEVMRGRTTILITHRYEVAASASRIFVLADGEILEEARAVATHFRL